ncbi:MAG: hypothetical protein HY271_19290 [Deltaproteobacteria bacterium]|nr:hypothetical protein [Deltaproteobacteria bacterium]
MATARGARVTAACALALIPVFAYFDTVLFAAHASQLLVWRLASFCFALAVFVLLLAPVGRRFPLLLGVVAPIAIGMNINLVTLAVGREANPYSGGSSSCSSAPRSSFRGRRRPRSASPRCSSAATPRRCSRRARSPTSFHQ